MKRNHGRFCLSFAVPLGDATTDTSKKAIRSFLAFPYGVLTLASYIKRFANNLNDVEVLDLNLPSDVSPDVTLQAKNCRYAARCRRLLDVV